MGNRLSKTHMRTGDGWATGLGDGSRVVKDRSRDATMDEVDDLNVHMGAECCIPGFVRITNPHIDRPQTQLDAMNQGLDRLDDFILPVGTHAAAQADLARTFRREVERAVLIVWREEGARYRRVTAPSVTSRISCSWCRAH